MGDELGVTAAAPSVNAKTIDRVHRTHRVARQRAPAVETRNNESPTLTATVVWVTVYSSGCSDDSKPTASAMMPLTSGKWQKV